MAAADPDPMIIINLSPFRCDAFLIERDRIRVLELPALKLKDVQRWTVQPWASHSSIAPLLEWIWDAVAQPVLEALGFTESIHDDGNWPRVWWIPTGILSNLPLHAARRHTEGTGETVLDRVMSSYASSVKALVYARRKHLSNSPEPGSDRALLAAMRETPELPLNGNFAFRRSRSPDVGNSLPIAWVNAS